MHIPALPRSQELPPPLRRLAAPLLMLLAVFTIYHGWLGPGIIAQGDWFPTPQARMLDYWPIVRLWSGATGLGGSLGVFGTILFPQDHLYGLLARLGIGYGWAERFIFVFPAIAVASLGGYVFSFSLFRSRVAAAIGGLFLVCNSYIVIIDGGGQYLVGVAFALMPLILWSFRAALRSDQGFRYVLTALLLALQGTYDLRLTYVTLASLALYIPFLMADIAGFCGLGPVLVRLAKQASIGLVMAFLVHAPWLLQVLLVRGSGSAGLPSLPNGYSDVSEAIGLSFMTMSNALSLMHPFWPLNALGHLAPLDPFLFLIPLVIFTLLLRVPLSRDVQYLFTLSLVSMFFVKGVHAPGGQIYIWFFVHVPGFDWFRDPSKFYQPLMLGMGLLLGLAVVEGARWLKEHLPWGHRHLVAALWTCGWFMATVYPALPGIFTSRAGTLIPRRIPQDYVRLNAMIDRQPDYFRTLLFLQNTLFVTYSERHPVLVASEVGSSLFAASQLPNGNPYSWLALPSAKRILQALSIKYVIMPSEALPGTYAVPGGPQSLGLTFQSALAQARRDLRGFRETTFGTIHVFENPHFLPLVYVPARIRIDNPGPAGAAPSTLPADVVSPAGRATPLSEATIDPASPLDAGHMAYSVSASAVPHVQVRRLGVSRIDVAVSGATRPFMLLFLQSYDPNWRAYIVPAGASPSWWTLQQERALPTRDHLRGEGFANAWWITARGSFSVVLLYWPQELVTIGGIACWLAILGGTGYVVFAWRRSVSGAGAPKGRRQRRVQTLPDEADEATNPMDRDMVGV